MAVLVEKRLAVEPIQQAQQVVTVAMQAPSGECSSLARRRSRLTRSCLGLRRESRAESRQSHESRPQMPAGGEIVVCLLQKSIQTSQGSLSAIESYEPQMAFVEASRR